MGDDESTASKPISCAYEYGVPQASGQFYHGDGAYSGGVWDAENLAKKWGRDPMRPCWVRRADAAGQPDEYCSIAMVVPGTLTEKAKGFWMQVFVGFAISGVMEHRCSQSRSSEIFRLPFLNCSVLGVVLGMASVFFFSP